MNEAIRQKILQRVQSIQDEKELLTYFEKVIHTLSPAKYSDDTMTLKAAMHSVLVEKKTRFNLKLQDPLFKDLKDIFWLTSGLHVIAAPSGHGKTFWAQMWAKETAAQGHAVLFLSLEMNAEDLGARTLAEISHLPIQKFVENDLEEMQVKLLQNMLEQQEYGFYEKIHIDKFGSLDWNLIYPRLWDRMMILKPKLIIIDYIQMIEDSEERDSRTSALLSNIARELKLFADKTETAVLLLSQMNRQALVQTKKADWEKIGFVPLTHEFIKESGGIVEAADSVQIVCIPERFLECPESFRDRFQLSIDKSRRIGKLKTLLFRFHSETMTFT